MDHIEATVNFIRAIEAADWFKVESMLDDDFRFYGPFPDPVGKETWLSFAEAIRGALPNLAFHVSELQQIDHEVQLLIHITGTHTKTLQLPLDDVKPLQPTLKRIRLPAEMTTIRYRDTVVHEIHTSKHLHAGFLGILEQLGAGA